MRKRLQFFLLLLSCSLSTFAQNETFYYYKGKAIPLYVNDEMVCVNVLKSDNEAKNELMLNSSKTISDDIYDITVFETSELQTNSKLKSLLDTTDDETILTPCYKTAEGKDVFSSVYLNVRLKSTNDYELLCQYAKDYNLEIIRNDAFLPLWYILAVTSNTSKTPLEVANELMETNMFASVVSDLCSEDILLCAEDPMFDLQWGLKNNTYSDVDVSACAAWEYATGKGVKIGILDTGFDLDHIDLADNVSTLSYDTETGSSPSKVYANHGTHCAGIAAAVRNNNIQIAGVAPDATVISISNRMIASTNNHLKLADGFVWAYQNGVDVISNSWHYSTKHEAIDEAISDAFTKGRDGKGSVIVFAAGNYDYDYINYPANCNDTILAVGAIDSTGVKAYFSSYGDGLDVVAPGVNILSLLPDDKTGYMDGTSMACPHVAGVAALLLERNPDLTVAQVHEIIARTAKKLSGVNFDVKEDYGTWNKKYGYGLVDAYNAVLNASTSIYIQNETVTGTRTYNADRIYVGKDVTDTKSYGDVTLGPGNITLKANRIEIKNSTTIPLGTTLTLTQ